MPNNRISAIDQFRGFAILVMILANFTGGIQIVPAWLKHAPDIGLTFTDLIAPFFIFAISLTYGLSFERRLERDGASFNIYRPFILRYLAIAGLGAILSAGETALGENASGIDWGVLQAIGVAGLLTMVVIHLRPGQRFLVGVGILVIYQVILDRTMLGLTLRSPHGGLFGSLNWAAMLILGTSLADLFHDEVRGRKKYPWAALAILAAGIGLAIFVPVSKNRVSSSYVLIALGCSALLFLLFYGLATRFHWQGRFLVMWGKNPLALYCLHFLLIGIFFLPGIPGLYEAAPPWLVFTEIALILAVCSGAASWLDKKKITISF
jgi:predicted acyltransferase